MGTAGKSLEELEDVVQPVHRVKTPASLFIARRSRTGSWTYTYRALRWRSQTASCPLPGRQICELAAKYATHPPQTFVVADATGSAGHNTHSPGPAGSGVDDTSRTTARN